VVKAHRGCLPARVSERLSWLKNAMWDGELGSRFRMALKQFGEESLGEEIQRQLGGVGYHERSPLCPDQRDGYYKRGLLTARGKIGNLQVPRSRYGTYEAELFRRYQRRAAEVDEATLSMLCRRYPPMRWAVSSRCSSVPPCRPAPSPAWRKLCMCMSASTTKGLFKITTSTSCWMVPSCPQKALMARRE